MSLSEYLVVNQKRILSNYIYLVYEQAVRESARHPKAYVTTRKFWETRREKVNLPHKATKRNSSRLKPETEIQVAKQYAEGMTQTRLAFRYKVTQSTISNIIKRHKGIL